MSETKSIARPHKRFPGVYIISRAGQGDVLATVVPQEARSAENSNSIDENARILKNESFVEAQTEAKEEEQEGETNLFRVWNPFCSYVASAILGGIANVPGISAPNKKTTSSTSRISKNEDKKKTLYIGNQIANTASFLADVTNNSSTVFVVPVGMNNDNAASASASEQQQQQQEEQFLVSEPTIVEMLEHTKNYRKNINILNGFDPRDPDKYSAELKQQQETETDDSEIIDNLIVDISGNSDDANDAVRILTANKNVLKKGGGGGFLLFMDANAGHGKDAAVHFADVVAEIRQEGFKPLEQITLEPFFRNVAILVGVRKE